MALPIWAEDAKAGILLGYTPDEQFDVPVSFNANAGCEEMLFGR